MKRFGILSLLATLAVAFAAVTLSPAARATTIFLDDFSAADGPLLGTTPDIGAVWTITGTSVVNPLMIAGNKVPVTTTGQDAFAAFGAAQPPGATLHTWVDLNVSAAQATGDYFLHLSDPAGTTSNFYQRLFARSSANGYQLGMLDTAGTNSATTWGTTELAFGTTYKVEVIWLVQAGPTNDVMFVNVDGSPYLTHNWTSVNAEPSQLTAINLRQGTATSAPTLVVDNLLVTASPEPSSAALVSLAGLALSAVRRRR